MNQAPSYSHEWHEQVDSTMNVARDWALVHSCTPVEVPHFIQAASQSQGRGKQGRPWCSNLGNFFATLVIHFPFPLESRGHLSFVTGISMVQALKSLAPTVTVKLKWPNDFYVGSKKIGGILLEYYDEGVPYMGIGVGLNIVSSPAYMPSTHLKAETQKIFDVHEIRELFMKKMLYNLQQWKSSGFHMIRDLWIASSLHIGQRVTLNQGKTVHEGLFETIHENGALVLKDEGGNLNMFSTGDVFFPPS